MKKFRKGGPPRREAGGVILVGSDFPAAQRSPALLGRTIQAVRGSDSWRVLLAGRVGCRRAFRETFARSFPARPVHSNSTFDVHAGGAGPRLLFPLPVAAGAWFGHQPDAAVP